MSPRWPWIAFVCLLAITVPGYGQSEKTFDISIREQPLGSALQVLARQLEVQIVFFSGATEGLSARPLEGRYTRAHALEAMLAGTGLRYVFLNENSVGIQSAPDEQQKPPSSPSADSTVPVAGTQSAEPAEEFGMDEIVVTGTASRVRTKFQSSVAISTYDRPDIARRAPSSTADLISAVPGFWVESTAGTTQGNVFARGIVQDGGYRYVGLVEDGLPVYPVFELSFYNPDQFIRPSQSTARVEVVRGGTAPIFTSGAIGGTINFINEAPSRAPEIFAKAGISDHGTRLLDVHWGAPLSESWRMAAGGYLRQSDGIRAPGYPADRGGQVRVDLRRSIDNGEMGFYAKYIDDRSLFVVPIPLRGNPDHPVAVDGSPAGEYSLHSSDVRAAGLPPSAAEVGLDGSDLADGIHPSLLTVGADLSRRWQSGISLRSHTRYTDGDVTFDGLFTGDVPVSGAAFAAARGVAPDFRFIATGQGFDPDFLVQNHGHWAIAKRFRSLQNDSRFTLATAAHDLSLGVYAADYSMSDRWSLGNLLLTDVGNRPRRLFLAGATDAAGFTRYSFLNLRADYEAVAWALYAADEWSVSKRLRLDFGLRYDRQNLEGSISNGVPDVDLDGDPATTYDIAALAGTERRLVENDSNHLSYSAGFNYDLTDEQALFGHFTRSAKLPHFDDIRNGVRVKDRVSNAELGYKVAFDDLALFLTAYRTDFDNVPFTDILVDGSTVVRRAETQTIGLELEGLYEPVDTLSVRFGATLQDPEYRDFTGTSIDNSGNRVRRIPQSMLRLVPSVEFAAGRGRAFLSFAHYGRRYANDENTIRLPSYLKLDAGIEYSFNDSWTAQLNVDNLSNEVGLTEGNPRTDVGASGIGQLYNARALFGRSLMLAVRYNFRSG
ncbi:MAG TPA: TonB-dependent receptor [Woeseiaceae bacterium]|nr:TonB-dependent receptor [Woeseiaceae bacterium]